MLRKTEKLPRQLTLESLEVREVLTATCALDHVGNLNINGTDYAEYVTVQTNTRGTLFTSDDLIEVVQGKPGSRQAVSSFQANLVNKIVFHGQGGDDTFENKTLLPSDAFGGEGNDVLKGGGSLNYLYGENGLDKLYAGQGRSFLYGGAGNDLLVSVGGKTNDVLSGGSGKDSFWLDSEVTETLPDIVAAFPSEVVHRVTGFNGLVNGDGQSQSVSRNRLGQSLIDPTPLSANPGSWQNYSNQPLFNASGPSMDDVFQGVAGDCYFVSALSAIAKTNPDRIRELVVDLGDGTYGIHFHDNDGNNRFYRVDGDLYTYNGMPVYSKLGQGGALWVAIVEKAYAFFAREDGKYASIVGGYTPDVSTTTALGLTSTGYQTENYSSGNSLLSHLADLLSQGKAITIGGPSWLSSGIEFTENAYRRGQHIFTVDAVLTDAQGNLSLRVRNPYGTQGPNGDGYITISAEEAFYCCIGFRAYDV